ncbi:hypothetical protein GCM10027160_41720 [Streptomyces calidiresistens]|uniref:Uncharacterized protein n=1 Tax=Streptomyces calidiresistens TaxID=1485586 RepID=A0A7W3T3I4_9ACTN|nr:hypothetical protein [Streptomyces calidiresistens]MBB0230269.1 hypothetical protein [Streptomyces calidiresistens]
MRGAVDQLLSREALSMDVSLDATPGEVLAHLREVAEREGSPAPTERDAAVLSTLELTAVAGDPEGSTRMRDLDRDDPLDTALSVGFGGKDAVGIKKIAGETYVRIGVETVVQDILLGDPARVNSAERFLRDVEELPPSLGPASRALRGAWALVDPARYEQYAHALNADRETVPADLAANVAAALTDAAVLLEPDAQWEIVDGLGRALRSGASLHRLEDARGAERYEVRLTAGAAERALAPLLSLLDEQSGRFGLPPVARVAADPDAPVAAEVEIRNGVLSRVVFDIGRFHGPDAAPLPLRLDLHAGSAISLNPPPVEERLVPADLTVALMYLDLIERQREEDPGRGTLPVPVRP